MKSRNKSRFALTVEGWIALCFILIILCLLGLYFTVSATTLDLDSLKKIVPEGECGGVTIEEKK